MLRACFSESISDFWLKFGMLRIFDLVCDLGPCIFVIFRLKASALNSTPLKN